MQSTSSVRKALERDRARAMARRKQDIIVRQDSDEGDGSWAKQVAYMDHSDTATTIGDRLGTDRWASEDCEDGSNVSRALETLRASTRKLVNMRRMAHGPQLRRPTDREKRFDNPLTKEEKAAVEAVLGSGPLMRKCCDLLESFQELLFADTGLRGGAPHPATSSTCRSPTSAVAGGRDPGELLNLAARVIHQVKYCTARSCWRTFMAPEQERCSAAVRKYDALRKQFNDARALWLKEVAALRDESRMRACPESCIADRVLDVTMFMDPVCLLTQEESAFALQVVTEKIKMIFDANPKVTQVADFGQFAKWQKTVETHQIEALRRQLDQKDEQVKQLSSALRAQNKGQQLVKAIEVDEAIQQRAAMQALVSSLEVEMGEAKARIFELEEEVRKLIEARDKDAQELQAQRVESEKRGREAARLTKLLQEAEESRYEIEVAAEMTMHTTSENMTDLRAKLAASQKAELLLNKRIEDLNMANTVLQETIARLRGTMQRRSSVRPVVAAGGDQPDGAAVTREATAKGEVDVDSLLRAAQDVAARDDLHKRIAQLEEERDGLQQALRDQANRLAVGNAGVILEEAEQLASASRALAALSTGRGEDAQAGELGSFQSEAAESPERQAPAQAANAKRAPRVRGLASTASSATAAAAAAAGASWPEAQQRAATTSDDLSPPAGGSPERQFSLGNDLVEPSTPSGAPGRAPQRSPRGSLSPAAARGPAGKRAVTLDAPVAPPQRRRPSRQVVPPKAGDPGAAGGPTAPGEEPGWRPADLLAPQESVEELEARLVEVGEQLAAGAARLRGKMAQVQPKTPAGTASAGKDPMAEPEVAWDTDMQQEEEKLVSLRAEHLRTEVQLLAARVRQAVQDDGSRGPGGQASCPVCGGKTMMAHAVVRDALKLLVRATSKFRGVAGENVHLRGAAAKVSYDVERAKVAIASQDAQRMQLCARELDEAQEEMPSVFKRLFEDSKRRAERMKAERVLHQQAQADSVLARSRLPGDATLLIVRPMSSLGDPEATPEPEVYQAHVSSSHLMVKHQESAEPAGRRLLADTAGRTVSSSNFVFGGLEADASGSFDASGDVSGRRPSRSTGRAHTARAAVQPHTVAAPTGRNPGTDSLEVTPFNLGGVALPERSQTKEKDGQAAGSARLQGHLLPSPDSRPSSARPLAAAAAPEDPALLAAAQPLKRPAPALVGGPAGQARPQPGRGDRPGPSTPGGPAPKIMLPSIQAVPGGAAPGPGPGAPGGGPPPRQSQRHGTAAA